MEGYMCSKLMQDHPWILYQGFQLFESRSQNMLTLPKVPQIGKQ